MKQIKNILLITKEFQSEFQGNVGGTGVFYKNISEGLIDRGINVFVFGSAKKPFDIQKEKLSVHFVKDYFKKYFLMELLRSVTGKISFLEKLHYKIYDSEAKYLEKELSKFIADKNIDIIETHDWEGISRIAKGLKIPYVIRCHGSWSVLNRFFGYGAAKGKIYSEKKAFENAENIITVSQSSQKMVREIFGNKDYHLIYNGIDTDFYQPQNSEKISKSIFFIGNISTEKGADTALNVFIKVHEREPATTLHFIGKDTELTEQLKRKIAENQIESKVIFYGKKNRNDVKDLLSKADVIIFPSRGETFGLALIEAMALEKPVVCSNLEVFSEIITEGMNGLIAQNEIEFSEKISELFSDKNSALNLSQNARKTVVEKFSLDQMIGKTLHYYQKISS
ncbi:glycosyltransferase family 4 protein [Chryseobacterium sp. Leaf394]|uniref:glycosyltransferase family 4 protein n=1 Tax=Chryseobacterium sp. Leaf394 TaxID=1736361 RepID=UPI0006F7A7A1|nr:glycosyltransferase family 4 protein [Chryseobacterium sp. Leaf394]KQS94326.1 hypothetical protein ASG21_19045 [Chryseobacterium sp. Leaf394]